MTMPMLSPTIFREYDIRGLVDQDLTEDAVFLVGKALGTRIREAGGRKAAVGRDARLSGPRFAKAMIDGAHLDGGGRARPRGRPDAAHLLRRAHRRGGRDLHDHRLPQPAGVQRAQGRPGLGHAPRGGDPGAAPPRRVGPLRRGEGHGRRRTTSSTPYRDYVPREPAAREAQAQGGGRRRERDRRRHRGAALRVARHRGRPALRRDGRPLPEPPPRPDRREEPRAPQGQGAGDAAPTWASPTTATPTASARSTSRGTCSGATSS